MSLSYEKARQRDKGRRRYDPIASFKPIDKPNTGRWRRRKRR